MTILTGFLGSGKTTLLRRLLADDRMARTAVIINEFGEVGLDHLLIGQVDDNTFLLDSGCLCCTLRTDFGDAITDILRRQRRAELPPIDRIIVETTGLADPLPLLQLLLTDATLSSQVRQQSITTAVDSTIYDHSPNRREKSRQIALADTIVLTKTDLVSDNDVGSLRERLRELNPQCAIIDGRSSDALVDALFSEARQTVVRGLDDIHVHDHTCGDECFEAPPSLHDGIGSICLRENRPIPWAMLQDFLRSLARGHAADVLRIKGIVNVAESIKPVVIHGVHQYLYPEGYLNEWPIDGQDTKIVVIYEGISATSILDIFGGCVTSRLDTV